MTRAQQPYPEIDPFEMEAYLNEGYRLPQPMNCPDQLFSVLVSKKSQVDIIILYTFYIEKFCLIFVNKGFMLGYTTSRASFIATATSEPSSTSKTASAICIGEACNVQLMLDFFDSKLSCII